MSVLICAVAAGSVLAINFVLTAWASAKYGLRGGLATIQEGSCQKTKTLSLWLHLAINFLSTLLLSASNYCMQCLSSPTREEVDRAHQRQIWLDIGVPSIRNLRQISWYKIALWWSLALSSIPLHLLYNSAVFSTLAAVEYSVYASSSDFSAGSGFNWSRPIFGSTTHTFKALQDVSNWQRLENTECINAYGQPFVSAHGDLLAISSDVNTSEPALWILDANPVGGTASGDQPYAWICQTLQDAGKMETCSPNSVLKNASNWTLPSVTSTGLGGIHYTKKPTEFAVDHCLSKPVEERCRLQFSLVIMCIVISCNLVKTVGMLLTLFYHKSQPLVTFGDAVSSFLKDRDPTTQHMCLANKKTFREVDWKADAGVWQGQRHKWFSAATARRWYICNLL